jgi:hypothetical protein
MAKALKQILTNNQAKLEVNLDELFGKKFPNDSSLRQAVGQAIIDKIRDRTGENIGANGKRFKDYSDAYKESIAFKAYGKSKSNPNLKQTGDMLGLMNIIEEKRNAIVIGWTDEEEAAKAHGHVTGNVGTKRDFLGLTGKDITELKSEWSREIKETQPETAAGIFDSIGPAQAFLAGQTIGPRTRGFGQLLREILDDEE